MTRAGVSRRRGGNALGRSGRAGPSSRLLDLRERRPTAPHEAQAGLKGCSASGRLCYVTTSRVRAPRISGRSRAGRPVWVYNLRANPAVEIRDHTVVQAMRVREVNDELERARLWELAVAAYPPYAEYQTRTTRRIPAYRLFDTQTTGKAVILPS
ncbi:MAG: nitroreductase/quinone reductase family protein [Candidatus Rokuibacteriota bacterium]